jgi:methyl-accepting chemotaxis protein
LTQIATNLAAGAQQQAAHSQKVSTQTARMAAELERAVAALDESSHSVREIVSTIKRVADQTRILSINASIEAARAGEFGRAFGAVAQEVEALSGQTMAATGQIGNRVETIQRNIRAAVDAAGLHSAEERRNAHTDSLSIRQLSSDMAEVARIATETAQAAGRRRRHQHAHPRLCEELLLEVGTFRMPVHEKASRLFPQLLAVPDLLSSSRMRAEDGAASVPA